MDKESFGQQTRVFALFHARFQGQRAIKRGTNEKERLRKQLAQEVKLDRLVTR